MLPSARPCILFAGSLARNLGLMIAFTICESARWRGASTGAGDSTATLCRACSTLFTPATGGTGRGLRTIGGVGVGRETGSPPAGSASAGRPDCGEALRAALCGGGTGGLGVATRCGLGGGILFSFVDGAARSLDEESFFSFVGGAPRFGFVAPVARGAPTALTFCSSADVLSALVELPPASEDS